MLTRWSDWTNFDWPELSGRQFDRTFHVLDQLRRDMDRLVQGWERPQELSRGEWGYFRPRVELDDAGNQLVIRAELPGMNEKDVQLSADGQTVTIRGQRKASVPEGYSVHRKERVDYTFERSYQLPCKVDPDKIEAKMRHGVLTLTLPKVPESQPKQITIKAA